MTSDAMAATARGLDPPHEERLDEASPGRRAYLQQVIHDALSPVRSKIGVAWILVLMFFACFGPFIASSHPVLMKAAGGWSSPLLKHLAVADVVLPVAFLTAFGALLSRRLTVGRGLALVIWAAAVTSAFAAWRSIPGYWAGLRSSGGRQLLGTAAASVVFGMTAIVVVAGIILPVLVIPRKTLLVTAAALVPLLVLLLVVPVNPPEIVVYERYREMQRAGQTEFVLRTVIPYSPTDRLRDQPEARLQPPSREHLTGTDNYSADLLSRQIHASRIALAIGLIATGIAVAIGIVVGGLMGYFSGTIDLLGMRLMEMLEAIPTLVLLIAITAMYGRNLYLMMAVIGLLSWTGNARFIRAEFLKLRNQDFVHAAVATGLPKRSIIFRHMLPNGISPVLVSASFGVAAAILYESTLSFLGLGLIDEPSWGEMLNQARSGGTGFNWWIATFPGLLIFLTVFSYNLVGEAVRDALDPKLLKRD
jgi:peptide/nickel transport system permease protein